MASSSDIRDIMNLGQAGPRQPAPKKKKLADTQPRMSGFKREVQALMGDSVPPIAIVEQRSYKSRPSISQKLFKPRHWEERPFQHGARTDGLVLRHWKRSIPGSQTRPPAVTNGEGSSDVEMTDDAKSAVAPELRYEDEFPSQKWNVKVQIPTYTDEQYENLLKADDWSRQETDYLMELCRDYDLRWVIIADRYDSKEIVKPSTSQENGEVVGSEVAARYPDRTMEALKQRYYAIAAKILETQIPISSMTQAEFQLWEKMRSFDSKTETMRKAMAEKLFERTKDEADEERTLLEELYRITKNEEDFIKMRADLYSRLEPVAPIRRTERGEEQSTAMYQTSAGLSLLLQNMLAKEKRLKPPRPMPEGAHSGHPTATPTEARKASHATSYSRRDTMDTQVEETGPQKKGSVSQTAVRVLTPQEEARFGVAHPQERLTSGVQFRHEKINRLTMAKSQTQTTKIQAALTELGIPPRLLMPTERVCREFERLVKEINILLDARKVNEKIATEIKILEEQRRIRLGLPKEGEQSAQIDKSMMEVDSSQIVDSKLETVQDSSMVDADEDKAAEGENNQEKKDGVQGDDDSTMAMDKPDEDADADEDEEVAEASQVKHEEEEDEDEEEDDDDAQAEEEDENGDDEDADHSAAEQDEDGVDEDAEEEEEDDEDDDDDEPQLGVDDDEDEEEGAEIAATPDLDSDAEEDGENEEQDEEDEEEEAEVEAEAEEESEDEAEQDEGEDAEADGDSDPGDETKGAEPEDSDEAGDNAGEEEEAKERVASASAAAMRAHKRSASVISEASRAGSNRSGMGRKKRR
ncbi:swr complex subunit [Rhinocladiella similis]